MKDSRATGVPVRAAAQEERVRFAWVARLFGRALGAYLRLVVATTRVSGPPITQERCVLAFWHESNLAAAAIALKLRHDQRMVTFSTRGFRGIAMNTMLESVGGAVLTMPDVDRRSRAEAARLTTAVAGLVGRGWSVVISCDGPWGPFRVAKPGALIVGREARIPVVPWAVACRPQLRLTRRWDRQLLPLPFGRMRVYEGRPLRPAAREPLKPLLPLLQHELDRVAAMADRRMAGGQVPG